MVEMSTARGAVGSGVVLSGNVDPVTVVRFGTPVAIRNAISSAYEEVGNPYMVNAGCEIPPGTPAENLKALCEPLPYAP